METATDNAELLRVEHVTYTSEQMVSLVDVSFSMNRGENLVIFGPENSGIEIICSLIAGLVEEFDGEILHRGRSIESYSQIERHVYRRELGYLQRDYGLINNMSAEENIALPLRYHSDLSTVKIREKVDGLIREMNLEYCRNLRPVDMSMSEILRTAYARSVALDPGLLLIEHALEGQCLINCQTFLMSLRKRSLSVQDANIIVTYEPDRFVDFSERFLMLYHGNIVFNGSREEFLSSDNKYLLQYKKSTLEGPMRIS